MIPYVYSQSVELDGTDKVIANLTDCIKCTVTEEINGEYTLELTYPLSGNGASSLLWKNIIMAKPSPYRDPQPFRIKKASISGLNGLISIYAEHISYDLDGYVISDDAAYGSVSKKLLFTKLTNYTSHFTFDADTYPSNPWYTLVFNDPQTIRSLCGSNNNSITSTYGGEWEFDGYSCHHRDNRGTDTGLTIAFGSNMKSIKATYDASDCYTHALLTTNKYPDNADHEYETWKTIRPSIDLEELNAAAPGTYRVVPLTMAELNIPVPYPGNPGLMIDSRFTQKSQYIKTPSWEVSASFADIAAAIGYKTEEGYKVPTVDIGDTVHITYKPIGLVDAESEITKISTDVLLERYNSISFGSVQTLSKTLSKVYTGG